MAASGAQRLNGDLLRVIPADARVVVEFGCGAGLLGEGYKRLNPHALYVGVEDNPDAAQAAVRRLDHVVTADPGRVEAGELQAEAGEIDCLVYNNVLEQWPDPWAVLRRHASWLRQDAVVAAALWNVQHWSVLTQLLRGQWPYQAEGLLDRNNLRYFTLDSARDLFARAGLNVFDMKVATFPGTDFQQLQQLLAPVLKAMNVDAEQFALRSSAVQFIVRGCRAPSVVPAGSRRLRIHTMMMAPLACDRIRVLEPDQFTNTIPGVVATSTVRNAQLSPPTPDEDRVFVIQRANMRWPTDLGMLKELLQRNYLIVAEMDDDPDRWPEHKANRYVTFAGCHCVQTSTEPLAAFLRELNPHVGVFANQIAVLPPPRAYSDAGPLRLFFGAINREGDWAPLMPALNRVLKDYQERVWVHVIHDQQFFNALTSPFKSFEQFCVYERYLEILHDCDVAILPLEPTRFNSMKSDLKFLECGAHGVAALASPTVYEATVKDAETGLIFLSERDFEEKLRTLLDSPTQRRGLAGKAYAWVKANRLLSRHYRERSAWYRQMLASLPQLQADLRKRVPELFA
jgi:glycosyltransferase involved in cell wall biosynthesis